MKVLLVAVLCLAPAVFGTKATDPRRQAVEEQETVESSGDKILVEDFAHPKNKWSTLNDPVMGGKSYSKVTFSDTAAHFTGRCAIVPSLQAPGFITMVTGGFYQPRANFPDVSSCQAFELVVRSAVDYAGYRFSFGKERVPGGRFAMGFKTPLTIPKSDDYVTLILPFSSFSDKWNDATGEIEVECKDDKRYCPTAKALRNLETISFWGEGVEGDADLEIKSISATGCASSGGNIEAMPTGADEELLPTETTNGEESMTSRDTESTSDCSFPWGVAYWCVFFVSVALAIAFASKRSSTKAAVNSRSDYEEVKSPEDSVEMVA